MNFRKLLKFNIKNLATKKIKFRKPYAILLIIIFFYILVFTVISFDNYNRFRDSAYDLGIQVQSLWLLSHGEDLFNTIRGLDTFAIHARYIYLLITPLFLLWSDAKLLLLLQALIIGLSAIPLYLIAKDKLKTKYLPLMIILSYFLFPALHYLNLENFHVDSFVLLFLPSAFYFAMKKKYYHFLIFSLLTLITKEEMLIPIFLLGIYVALKHNKKWGLIISLISVGYLIILLFFLFPYFGGGGSFKILGISKTLGEFARPPNELILYVSENPEKVASRFFNQKNANYLFDLFAPVSFLSLLSPSTLAIAGGSILLNTFSAWFYAHSIKYHYTAAIVPFIFISLIFAISKFRKIKKVFYTLFIILICSSIVSNIYMAPGRSSIKNYKRIYNVFVNYNNYSDEEKTIYSLINKIPDNASVSVNHLVVCHLANRKEVYFFPNPFELSNWGRGVWGEHPHAYKKIDYILLRKSDFNTTATKSLLNRSEYKLSYNSSEVIFLERSL